ncbi:MAG: cytidylate kinase-like family protein [Gemmatimonadetes bacterium]|nr:cytidylate kinase-like family protein [Gemmatimonadota bacterium]MCH7716320.1 cytidylate kinase-like family protein [Gemmatimonadota bacterium]
MAVITISRQYASGGAEIARMVADRLGWTLIDGEFVDRVAERVGLPPEEIAIREERVPSLLERLGKTLAVSSPEAFLTAADYTADDPQPAEEIVQMTNAVIKEAAEHGDVVLVGRGAQAYLASRDDAVHVRIVAPMEDRIRAAQERLDVSAKEAERTVNAIDHDRKAYVHTHYQRDWEDAANYHMIINSSRMSNEHVVDLIVQAAKKI